jgi:hypothetical protein
MPEITRIDGYEVNHSEFEKQGLMVGNSELCKVNSHS